MVQADLEHLRKGTGGEVNLRKFAAPLIDGATQNCGDRLLLLTW
jgi:hypothetical protein